MISEIQHLVRMSAAAGICTALIGYGLFGKRKDRSRRWVFVYAGIVGALFTGFVFSSSDFREEHEWFQLIAGLVLILPAVVAMVYGWRGKRVGDHPYCRKCGFDLFGKPEATTRCNECGTELSGHKAVVIGVKQVRAMPVLTGIFFLLFALLVAAPPGWQMVKSTDWAEYKPMWWLLADMDSPAKRGNALLRIMMKLNSGDITSGQLQSVANHVLSDMDAGRSNNLFYSVVLSADKHDWLDEVTARRLMRKIANLGFFRVMPVSVRGLPIKFRYYHFPSGQMSSQGELFKMTNIAWKVTIIDDRIGDIIIPPACIHPEPGAELTGNMAFRYDLGSMWDKIPIGPTTITRKLDVQATMTCKGKLLEERISRAIPRSTTVIEPAQAALPLVAPTPADLNNQWTATCYTAGTRRVIEIAPRTGRRVFAHVWVASSRGKDDLGIVNMYGSRGILPLPDHYRLPDDKFTLELIPAPEEGAGEWNRMPILNQKIVITNIERRHEPAP